MEITPLKKMASGRNLLWSHIQGGHRSHGNTCPEQSYVYPQDFLERLEQAPDQTFPGLPGGADLADQVSFHSRNFHEGCPNASRQPAAFPQWFAKETKAASGGQPRSFGSQGQQDPATDYRYRRYDLFQGRQKDRRLGRSPLLRWSGQGPMCGDLCFADRRSMAELGRGRLSAQILLSQGRIQEQNSIGARDPSGSSSHDSYLRNRAHGQLVYLRSYPYSYYRSRLDFRGRDQMQPYFGSERQENRRSSPGQGTEDVQNRSYFQKTKAQSRQTNRPPAQGWHRAPVYHQRRRQRNQVFDYQRPSNDRISDGPALQPALCNRDLPQGHQTALGLLPRLYAFLAGCPNTLDSCHDRLQPDYLVGSQASQGLSSKDSSFQKDRFSSEFVGVT